MPSVAHSNSGLVEENHDNDQVNHFDHDIKVTFQHLIIVKIELTVSPAALTVAFVTTISAIRSPITPLMDS